MRAPPPLRPELASVCRFLAPKRAGRVVRVVQTNGGVLSELAASRGMQ
ncbi:MAG: hypothetical protein ACT4N8_00410 [Sphingosinicella sp.]